MLCMVTFFKRSSLEEIGSMKSLFLLLSSRDAILSIFLNFRVHRIQCQAEQPPQKLTSFPERKRYIDRCGPGNFVPLQDHRDFYPGALSLPVFQQNPNPPLSDSNCRSHVSLHCYLNNNLAPNSDPATSY